MNSLLLILVMVFSTLSADEIERDTTSTKRCAFQPPRKDLFQEFEDEKQAKRQKKFGTRASSTLKNNGNGPKCSVRFMIDKSKLGHEPSRYSDTKKRKENLEKKTPKLFQQIRYVGLSSPSVPAHLQY